MVVGTGYSLLTHDRARFRSGVTAHLICETAWRHAARLYRMPAELAHNLRQATRCASIPAALRHFEKVK
jgi:hypothetical protein